MAADVPPDAATARTCTECGTAYQSTWRWCLACGHDPDGVRPAAPPTGAAIDAAARSAAASSTAASSTSASSTAASSTAAGAGSGLVGTGGGSAADAGATPAGRTGHARRKTEAVVAEAKKDGPWSIVLIVIVALLVAGGIYLFRVRSNSDSTSSASAVSTLPIQWATYTPDGGGFTVELPGKPFVNNQEITIGGVQYTLDDFNTLAGQSNVGVSVMTPTTPGAGAADPDTALRDYATAMASRLNSQVGPTTPVQVNGSPGLDYLITVQGGGEMRGRLIKIGDKTFNLYIVSAQPQLADLERITSSFVPA